MYRPVLPWLGVLILLLCARCVKYVDPPVMEAQRLITKGSWVLAYTDSTTFDSANVPHYFHTPASDCEKKESLSFAFGPQYHVHVVCKQPSPGEFIGSWNYLGPDSSFGYGLQTDSILITSKLILVTGDSLKLIQRSSFATPDILYGGFAERTYSR